jgi:hypothetical protein
MSTKIVLHIADRDLIETVLRVIEADPYLAQFQVSFSEQENRFEPDWVYVIDRSALGCPRVKEMALWKDPHVVLMIQSGDCASYDKAWQLNIRKVVDSSLPPDIMRLALTSEALGAAQAH